MTNQEPLEAAKDEFINQWGVIGSRWGINRTMAQIHALLMVSTEPLTTDEVMDELGISRGNAHSNLRELEQWRLVRSVIKKGVRKEFFEAEKDVAKIFSIILKERKSREFDPALEVLQSCRSKTEKMKSPEAKAFQNQIGSLCEFVEASGAVLDKASKFGHSKIFNLILKRLT